MPPHHAACTVPMALPGPSELRRCQRGAGRVVAGSGRAGVDLAESGHQCGHDGALCPGGKWATCHHWCRLGCRKRSNLQSKNHGEMIPICSMYGIFTYILGWFWGLMLVKFPYMEHRGYEMMMLIIERYPRPFSDFFLGNCCLAQRTWWDDQGCLEICHSMATSPPQCVGPPGIRWFITPSTYRL